MLVHSLGPGSMDPEFLLERVIKPWIKLVFLSEDIIYFKYAKCTLLPCKHGRIWRIPLFLPLKREKRWKCS